MNTVELLQEMEGYKKQVEDFKKEISALKETKSNFESNEEKKGWITKKYGSKVPDIFCFFFNLN